MLQEKGVRDMIEDTSHTVRTHARLHLAVAARPLRPFTWRDLPPSGNLLDAHTLVRNLVHLLEQRVGVCSASSDQEVVDLLGGRRSLKLLAVQQLLLELRERLARLGKLLSALPVSASVARRDQVGDTGRLVRECIGLGALEELEAESSHLLETDSEDGGLRVAAEAETVDESSSERDDVLQGARERDTGDIVDGRDVEDGGSVENGGPELGVDSRWRTNGRLAELALGN